MTEKIFVFNPQLPETLQRAFGLQPRAPSFLGQDIQVGVQLVDLADHQYLWLGRIGTFHSSEVAPTNAGRASCLLFETLATSRIYRLRRLILSQANAAAQQIRWQVLRTTDVVPAVLDQAVRVGIPRDSRMIGAQVSNARVTFGTTLAGGGSSSPILLLPPNTPVFVPLDITLAPGGGFFLAMVTNNIAFTAILEWDERDGITEELR